MVGPKINTDKRFIRTHRETSTRTINNQRTTIVCKNPFSFLATLRVPQKCENQNQNTAFGKNRRAAPQIL